ncbi:MAG: c-type cytochrome [Egibacteraceae bacterium]
MTPTTIAITVLAIAGFATVVLLIANASSKRRSSENIPPALRPAYSDEQLEGNVLERYMLWGLVLTLFFAAFLPIYGILEPGRIERKQQEDFIKSFARGEELFTENCARCHGADGTGGATASPYGGDPWPVPNLTNMAARYDDSAILSNTDMETFVRTTIRRGRPGTPMPSWGVDFQGPLSDVQIDALVNWVLANQVPETVEPQPVANLSGQDLFQQNCAKCHGENLQGIVGPSLVGLFERHDRSSVLGILQNGISVAQVVMPAWQNGYTYEDARFTDSALERIIDYLEAQQPAQLPGDADQYQTPGVGEPVGGEEQPAPVQA